MTEFIKVKGLSNESIYIWTDRIDFVVDMEMIPSAQSRSGIHLIGGQIPLGVNTKASKIMELIGAEIKEESPLSVD